MPKQTINTFSSMQFVVDGKVKNISVNKVFSEDENLFNKSKEVSFFDKYSSKKKIEPHVKISDGMEK